MVFTEYKKCSCEIGFLVPTVDPSYLQCTYCNQKKQLLVFRNPLNLMTVLIPRASQYLCDTPDIAASGNNVYITFAKYKTGFADAYIMRNTQESDKKVLSDLSGM